MKKFLLLTFVILLLVVSAACSRGLLENADKYVGLDPISIIVLIAVGIALCTIPTLFMMGKMRKQLNSWRHLNDFDPTREETFDEKIKKLKMQPERILTYGQNYFACDSIKKKLLVQSDKTPDMVLLDYKDVISYEIIKDGQAVRRGGAGQSVQGGASGENVSSRGGEPLCSDLQLVITTNKASNSETILPFVSFSIDSEFAYREALGAAMEAADELDRIIRSI